MSCDAVCLYLFAFNHIVYYHSGISFWWVTSDSHHMNSHAFPQIYQSRERDGDYWIFL